MRARVFPKRNGEISECAETRGVAARHPAPAMRASASGARHALGNQHALQVLRMSQQRDAGGLEAEAERAAQSGQKAGTLSKVPAGMGHAGHGHGPQEGMVPGGSSGTAMEPEIRRPMEARFDADLSQVRIHRSAAAAEMNERLNARAFTFGQDIYFNDAEYHPETDRGGRLLAHELAHTVQQNSGTKAIQMQPKGQGGEPAPPAITAQEIFGMAQNSHVVLGNAMNQFLFSIMQSQAPPVAAALNAINAQEATLSIVDDNRVVVTLDKNVTLPKSDKSPAYTYTGVAMTLLRTSPGVFNFTVTGTAVTPGAPVLGYADNGLTATRSEGSFVLSAGTTPHLRITPASGPTGETRIEAYTAPYMSRVPEEYRMFVPEAIDLAKAKRLPDAPAAPEDKAAAVKRIVEDMARQRSSGGPNRSVMLGGGIMSGSRLDPMLTASFTYRFTVSPKLGAFLTVPVEAELMYAPSTSVIGTLSSGVSSSLADLKIPVNIRLITGFGGGQVPGPVPKGGGPRPELGVLGPTLGAGVGLEAKWFRVDLRYEHLFNVLSNQGPGVHAGTLRVGAAF